MYMEWCLYNYLFYSKRINAYLLYSSLSNKLIKLTEQGYKEIKQIQKTPELVYSDSRYRFLVDGRFVVESNKVEQNKLVLSALQKQYCHNTLTLTIAPTRACNFNCPYCFEKDRTNTNMSTRTQNALIDFVRRHKSSKRLNVIWYGGEPTTAVPTIKYLSSEFQKAAASYDAYMVTNGYNLDNILDDIQELKISGMQITLDGTKDQHDKTRHLKNGGKTFDKIISNLELLMLKTKDVKVAIRMNISKENGEDYVNLYNFLKSKFDSRVALYPAFVRDYNGSCPLGSCYDNSQQQALYLKDLFWRNHIYTYPLYPYRRNKGCMMHTTDSYVVGPDGEFYKCWNDIGIKEKIIGNIHSDNIISNYGLLSNMMLNNNPIFDINCKECILFPSCDGGCANLKTRGEDYCIPAKSKLEDFLEIRYIVLQELKKKDNILPAKK